MDLAGKRVAFTGRLACMTRPEAADLVRARGGIFVARITRRTSLLVVGQEGLPLNKNGGLADEIEIARTLQSQGKEIGVLTEEQFLRVLGLEGDSEGVHRRFTLAQLCRLLKVSRDRLRFWIRAGWLTPVEKVEGVCYFDFHQVAGIRSLWTLAQAGVTPEKMRRSLDKLAKWFPDLSLEQLGHLAQDGRLLVRMQEGNLADLSGQLYLDFESAEDTCRSSGVASSSTHYREACEHESAGRLAEAAQAYAKALSIGGPDAGIHFNLGNVLFALGALGQAAEHFRNAVDLDADFVDAWNNLGNVLLELGESVAGEAALQRALLIDPHHTDAHYSLADALECSGRVAEARRHWQAYLRLEPIGEWATYARSRLAERIG